MHSSQNYSCRPLCVSLFSHLVFWQPAFDGRRVVVLQAFEEGGWVVADVVELAVLRFDETVVEAAIEEAKQIVEVAAGVEEADRLGVNAELCPGDGLEEFFEGAESAGKSDEGVGEIRHEGFASVHVGDEPHVLHTGVEKLAHGEQFGNYADDVATSCENGIGDDAHHADAAATVDEFDASFGQQMAQGFRGSSVFVAVANTGAAVDADSFHATIIRCKGR